MDHGWVGGRARGASACTGRSDHGWVGGRAGSRSERMQRPLGSWVGGCCGWAGGLAGCVRRSEAFGWRRGRAKERRTTDRPRFEASEIMGGWAPTHLPTQIHMHHPIGKNYINFPFPQGATGETRECVATEYDSLQPRGRLEGERRAEGHVNRQRKDLLINVLSDSLMFFVLSSTRTEEQLLLLDSSDFCGSRIISLYATVKKKYRGRLQI